MKVDALKIVAFVLLFAAMGLAAETHEGVVTFARRGNRYFFMQTDSGAVVRAELGPNGIRPEAGERVRVTSDEPPYLLSIIRLHNARVECLGKGDLPKPAFVPLEDLLRDPYASSDVTNLYGRLVETEGIVRDINRRRTYAQMLIGEGHSSIQITIPWAVDDPAPEGMRIGARVRVAGLFVFTAVERDGKPVAAENFDILMADGAFPEIISRPPFWTPAKFWCLIGTILFFAGLAVAWVRWSERAKADAVRRERLRLSHDLHDGFQQLLAGSMFRLEAAMNFLPEGANQAREQLERVSDSLYHTQTGLRAALWSMTEESEGPGSLSGLVRYAASRLAHWEGIVRFEFKGEERQVSRKIASDVLLLLQEAVGNALRHGRATNVDVKFSFRSREVVISIRDNGCGFDPSAIEAGVRHLGLRSMRERAEGLRGALSLTSEIGAGTIVVVRIPYEVHV